MTEERTDFELLYLSAAGEGWWPVHSLAALASKLLGARLTVVEDTGVASLPRRLASMLPRRRSSGRRLLILAANPGLLAHAARVSHWFPGYDEVAVWVIDSFWAEHLSRIGRTGRHFDRFFITDKQLIGLWKDLTGKPVHWLPWGTDTLGIEASGDRPVDLLRLGRQPEAWSDNAATIADAAQLGLRVQGGAPRGATSEENQQILRDAMLSSKCVLAFNNLVSPAKYTHPTRDYVTARWTDSLAAGATVVGAAPSGAADLLWPGATVEIDPKDRAAGLATLQGYLKEWEPAVAQSHQAKARRRLDWRWRLQELCEVMGWAQSDALRRDLAQLDEHPAH
ncbi:MAG: glycosyltransferase [Propionibacteriaceae bacterium]|nr:glycosyltransferase [Propionibacteriaceae bacterium]